MIRMENIKYLHLFTVICSVLHLSGCSESSVNQDDVLDVVVDFYQAAADSRYSDTYALIDDMSKKRLLLIADSIEGNNRLDLSPSEKMIVRRIRFYNTSENTSVISPTDILGGALFYGGVREADIRNWNVVFSGEGVAKIYPQHSNERYARLILEDHEWKVDFNHILKDMDYIIAATAEYEDMSQDEAIWFLATGKRNVSFETDN